ncbi:ribonuclease H-like [Gymnogyps californianus]|uniref:ribonuclease H-like n=1 Tax=Gymnogyps californianus TaxID=33616 RepID=UPI0021C8AF17|nr:ribonuclease H-like [Gymnogyps californianus]
MTTEEVEGSAQVGELHALLLAAENGATVIYTDSYATYKGATEWICQWESNQWKVGCTKVWRTRHWQRLLEIGRSRPLKVGWVKGHARNGTPTAKWNQQVDHLAQIKVVDSDKKDWGWLAE